MSQFEEKSPGPGGLRDHGRAGPGLPRGRRGPRPGALRGVLEPALLPGPPRPGPGRRLLDHLSLAIW